MAHGTSQQKQTIADWNCATAVLENLGPVYFEQAPRLNQNVINFPAPEGTVIHPRSERPGKDVLTDHCVSQSAT